MSKTLNIDSLLSSPPSNEIAAQLIQWVNDTRNQITRGDMTIGILTTDEAAKIPTAYQSAAEYGHHRIWLELAWWHAYPDFGKADLDLAEFALNKAIINKVKGAELELVKIRWFFKQDTVTVEEANEAYQLVVQIVNLEPENAEATYILALLTTHGFGCQPYPETGFKLQQRAANLGNKDAMFELFIHYSQGLGVLMDKKAAFSECERAAKAGHSRAMYNLGAFNANGKEIPKNIPEAIKWYERSANAGNGSAMAGLAVIYTIGDDVEPDFEYALKLLDQAEYYGLDVSQLREDLGFD